VAAHLEVVALSKIKPPRVFSAAAIFLSGDLSGFSGFGFECCYTVQMVLHLVFQDTG
jgi:hypothetical protein